jgi:hypothetical protein
MEPKKYRIFILGAGFSRPAGFPLASALWDEVRKRAQFLSGRAGKFHTDLRNYLDYKRECDGVELSEDQVDFEDFMRVLDIEHFLGLRGSDTWSPDGNEGTIVVKTLIGHILAELTPLTADIPKLYLNFAKRLQPGDYVLNFNYDILLERALEAVGKPYRLFPDRYESVHQYGATIDNSKQEVSVLKLHGSIDWFDRGSYAEWEQHHREAGLSTSPDHPVFCTTDELGATKLLDGPRHSDDPLNQMYRVRDIKALYQKPLMFLATPWLLAPSNMKILYAEKLRDFWGGLGRAGVLNFGLAIIGYSLPPQDEYARQVVYSLVTNYQRNYWDEKVYGKRKSPLVIVDCCRNGDQLESFKEHYRFVDWRRTTLYTDGLNEEAVDLIFDKR